MARFGKKPRILAKTAAKPARFHAAPGNRRLPWARSQGVIAPSHKGPPMTESLQPILAKTPVLGLQLHIGRSGICIGDAVNLWLTETGDVLLIARIKRRRFGFFSHRKNAVLGHLGPAISRYLAPGLQQGASFRVRIVGLTPEHLCGPAGPEVFVSIWADPLRLPPLSFQGA